ncbi:D-aminoacyl-tRNA deacylase [uncultured Chloroflexus sp.]|uniref:D-aminoacyl-tRNA deacylase n=1 Tax=uncultured Chloroflexus sp. TaxID=214040 RepID=UPI00261F7CD6|nr:D-aminoacyl-tRNA deacylase [uncultured Chloroflexus sp.]
MRAVIQRVSEASVTVNGSVVGAIGHGLLILLGVTQTDTLADVDLLAEKIAHLRIFGDHEGKFNLSLIDVGGAALVVSQFTLYADTRKGRRPSFTAAARPEIAKPLVDAFADALRARAIPVATGVFGAMMHVALINDGPVTIVIDSAELRLPRRSN